MRRFFGQTLHSTFNSNHLLPDVEIAKLEKRKARYQERSPSPRSSTETRPVSPTLPLPSPNSGSLPAETNSKIMFLSMLGLWRLAAEDKQGEHHQKTSSYIIFISTFIAFYF
jgi:hypothetical protein